MAQGARNMGTYLDQSHGSVVKNLPVKQETRGFDPQIKKILWRKKWQPTPGFLPGKSQPMGSQKNQTRLSD